MSADLAWVFFVLAAVAGCAWFNAERQVAKLYKRNATLRVDNHTLARLLGDAIRALPDTPRGRALGDAVLYHAWEDRKKQRLERHLRVVDRRVAP